jgi:hypothetical protein
MIVAVYYCKVSVDKCVQTPHVSTLSCSHRERVSYQWSGGIAPLVLNIGTRGGKLSASRLGEVIDRGGPQSLSGRFGIEKNLLAQPGIKVRFLVFPSRSLVTIA